MRDVGDDVILLRGAGFACARQIAVTSLYSLKIHSNRALLRAEQHSPLSAPPEHGARAVRNHTPDRPRLEVGP